MPTALINIYNNPTELFCDNQVLWSCEGTTQGDPLAMPFYALATLTLIKRLSSANILQVWYADDSSATGKLVNIKVWWEKILEEGPAFGYYANPIKSWLVVKENLEAEAKHFFKGINLNITTIWRPLLGAAVGSDEFVINYVKDKVNTWANELSTITSIAEPQPHAAYSAYIYGFLHKFNFICRTLPNVNHLFQPIEDLLQHHLIPKLTGRPPPSQVVRDLLALPARWGGMGLSSLTRTAS